MRISDWSSDVCSSDLPRRREPISSRCYLEPPEDGRRDTQKAMKPPISFPLRVNPVPCALCANPLTPRPALDGESGDRTRVVSGTSVSVRFDLGGRRIIQKNNISLTHSNHDTHI